MKGIYAFIFVFGIVHCAENLEKSENDYEAFEYELSSDEDHELFKRQATSAFRQKALKLHNDYRARHGSPPLQIDEGLNKDAQEYANHEAKTNVQKHSCGPCDQYGENLAYTGSTGKVPHDEDAAEWACKAWYDEISLYDFSSPNLSKTHKYGHFTALVWKGSKKVGFGVTYGTKMSKKGNKLNTVYVVARYYPPGNMWEINAMRKNVPPPI